MEETTCTLIVNKQKNVIKHTFMKYIGEVGYNQIDIGYRDDLIIFFSKVC